MIEPDLEYLVPSCIEEAVAFQRRFGENARYIAGGTEIVPLITRGKLRQTCLIELSRLPELNILARHEGVLHIGAAATLSQLHQSALISAHWVALAEACASIHEPQVRNRGTIGGNVAHGVPSADLIPPLLVFEAKIKLCGSSGVRLVPLDKFLIAPYRTDLRPDEIVAEIQLPEPGERLGSAFRKLTKYGGSGLSVATVAAAVSMQDGRISTARVAMGSAGPLPHRVIAAETFLEGKKLTSETLLQAGRSVSEAAEPREGSIRASPTYRRRVLKVLAERAITSAAQQTSAQYLEAAL